MMLRQLASALILPVNAIVTMPIVLYLWCGKRGVLSLLPGPMLIFTRLFGLLLIFAGFSLLFSTIRNFVEIGQGTLAPWDPTRKLVVHGVYRYVRNPMISGVISILFGIALTINSLCHLVWALLFTLANVIYMPLSEEPGLVDRFGSDYLIYQQNVPRWIPRLHPWDPPGDN